MRIMFGLVIFLIAYGSLYPFDFQFTNQEWDAFFNPEIDKGELFRFSDLLANIVLFIPYGVLGFIVSTESGKEKTRILAVFLGGIFFSAILQFFQIYLPDRVVAISDIIWNTLGIIIGLGIGSVSGRWLSSINSRTHRWLSPQGFLIGSWVASELIPFVPTLQLNLVKDNLKGLIDAPFSIVEMLFHLVAWSVVAYWMKTIGAKKSLLTLLILITFVAKVFIVNNLITASILLGGILAIVLWWCIEKYLSNYNQITLLTVLLITVATANAFIPFELNGQINEFGWLPFSGFLSGSMLSNSQALCEKVFLYGSLIWFIKITSSNLIVASVAIAFWALLIEIMQLFVDSHTSEITDPLLVVIIAFVLRSVEKSTIQTHGKYSEPASIATPLTTTIASGSRVLALNNTASIKSLAITLGIAAGVIACLIKFALGLPKIPYNVKEMFLGDGNIVAIFVFSVVLLWVGMSSVICSQLIQKSKMQFLALPGYVFLAGLVSLALLYLSVTEESIADITGSTNLNWQVNEKRIWGDFGASLFGMLNAPKFISFVERIFRYLALYSPVVFSLVIFNMLWDQAQENISKLPLKTIYLTVISLPWFLLCKVIAFDYSSTDNINELIARPGAYGMGGGGYLYLLLLLITCNAAFISRLVYTNRLVSVFLGLMISVLAIPLGWYLLNEGLVTDFKKYDTVYSGVDFLLGPDRTKSLSTQALFFRWSLVQFGLVLLLSFGQKIILATRLKEVEKPNYSTGNHDRLQSHF